MLQRLSNNRPSLNFSEGNLLAVDKLNGRTIHVIDSFGKLHDKSQEIITHLPNKPNEYMDLEHVPNNIGRNCLYVCAPNQSGKTTYIAKFLKWYQFLWKNRRIIVFSSLESDPILDVVDPVRVPLSLDFINEDLNIEEFNDSVCVFDDVDKIKCPKLKKALYALIEELLCNGAHMSIDVIVTQHLMSNYRETRCIINETNVVTVFPQANRGNVINFLINNIGLTRKQAMEIIDLGSRWVTIFRRYPMVVLYDAGVYLL